MIRTDIEWCVNADGTRGFTWNPVTGCLHPCRNKYCYANDIATRFDSSNGAVLTGANHVAEAGMKAFPFRFDPTFYPNRVGEPLKHKKPSTIFVCSMADLFGAWVPPEWIEQVLETVSACPQHTFIFLTKNPARYAEFELPGNCWAGVTLTGEGPVREAAMLQGLISAVPHRRYVSIEPLRARLDAGIIGMLDQVDRIIIGAQTGPGSKAHQPAPAWINEIVAAAGTAGIPVFLKSSLKTILNTGADDLGGGNTVTDGYLWDLHLPEPEGGGGNGAVEPAAMTLRAKSENMDSGEQPDSADMSADEEQEAIAYLRDPGLLENLTRDIKLVGQVVGEEENQMLGYMSYTSRKLDRPFSFVVTGQSSAGKTSLVKGVLKTIPPEDVRIYSSATAKSFVNSKEDELRHKVIMIEELDGAKQVLATVRLLQSEGRLNHIRVDASTKCAESRELNVPCVVVTTANVDRLNDENATRVFELTTDDSIDQTKAIVGRILEKYTAEGIVKEAAIQKRQKLLHNVQRLIKPVRVVIPYATKLRLPNSTTRNRRDSERFMNIVSTVTYLRQYQKGRSSVEGTEFIEADMTDYAYAYRYGRKILQNTVAELSERSWNVLNVICQYHKHRKDVAPNSAVVFTLKDIQTYGASIGVDMSNTTNMHRMFKVLVTEEYVTLLAGGGQGKTGKYMLNYDYRLNAHGEVDTTWRGGALNLTTPDELLAELGGNAPSATKEAAAPGSHTAQRKETVPMSA